MSWKHCRCRRPEEVKEIERLMKRRAKREMLESAVERLYSSEAG